MFLCLQNQIMIIQKIKELFTKKIAKKILMIAVIFWLWGAVFFVWNQCFAEGDTTTETQSETEKSFNKFNEISEQIIHLCYMLLWPVIRVCGILLDNTMIYGTWLHLDISLWTLWNVMKNFANYLLWFMVIFSILKNLFTLKWAWWFKDAWWPLSVIKNTVIAWVLIQMSRFIVAALIDISSILTYSVWWLPTTLMWINDSFKDTPVIWVSAYVNATWSDNWSSVDFFYTYGDHKIYKCRVERTLALPGAYIVWPEKIYMERWGKTTYFDTWYCALWWWPYKYNHDEWNPYPSNNNTNTDYKTLLSQNLTWTNVTPEIVSWWIESCTIIPVNSEKQNTWCVERGYWEVKKNSDFFVGGSTDWESTFTINNLMEQSKWYVWQLITMYASILDYSTLADVQPWDSQESYTTRFIDIIFRLFFVVILFIPLATLAIVLVIRIWILWLAIIGSPLLIVLYVFKWELSWIINIDSDWWWRLSLKNMIALIFAPVVVTFAISIALVFMSAITLTKPMDAPWVLESFGIEKVDDWDDEETTYSILWLFDLTLKTKRINNAQDNISYFITLLLATWIIRFFLMAAFKAMWKVWEIWEKIQKQVQTFAWSVPIVPIGGWKSVWINAIKEGIWQALPTETRKMDDKSNEVLKRKYSWIYGMTPEAAMSYVKAWLSDETKTIEDIRRDLEPREKKELDLVATQVWVTGGARALIEKLKDKNSRKDITIPEYDDKNPNAKNFDIIKGIIAPSQEKKEVKSATDKVIDALSKTPQEEPNLTNDDKKKLEDVAKAFNLETVDDFISKLKENPTSITTPSDDNIPSSIKADVDKIIKFIKSKKSNPNT